MSENRPVHTNAFDKGHAAAWHDSWEDAADFYRQAFEQNPDHEQAASYLAFAFHNSGDFLQALHYYQIAANLLPRNPVTWERMAEILERLERLPESTLAFEKSVGLYLQAGNTHQAVSCLQQILRQNPNHTAAKTRLAAIDQSGIRSLPDMSKWIDDRPASTLMEPSQPDINAPNPLEKAKQTAVADLAALFFELASPQSGNLLVPEISKVDAHQTGREIKEDPENFEMICHISQAIEHHQHGLLRQCLSELKKLQQSGMNNASIHFLAGSNLLASDITQALSYLKHVYTHPDYALASFLMIGKTYFGQGNYKHAAAAYIQALAVAENLAVSMDHSVYKPDQFKSLVQSYAREQNITVLKRLCETLENELNRPDWREHLTQQHSQLPQENGPNDNVMMELLAAGGSVMVDRFAAVKETGDQQHPRSAIEEAFSLIDDGPVMLPAQILIAENLGKLDRTEEAVQKLRLATDLYSLRGQTDQAIQAMEMAVQLAPLDIPVRSQLIELLKKNSQISQAVEHMRKLAEIHSQLTETEKAHHILSEAIRLIRTSANQPALLPSLLHQKAELFLRGLHYQQASQVYEQIIILDPFNIPINAKLATLEYRLGQREQTKQRMNHFIQYLQENQKTALVEQYLHALITELPDVLEIRKNLADWYHRRGDKLRTIEQLDIIANQLIGKGKLEAALVVLKTIVVLNPPDEERYQQLIIQLSTKM